MLKSHERVGRPPNLSPFVTVSPRQTDRSGQCREGHGLADLSLWNAIPRA